MGVGHAYFLRSTRFPEVCKPETPLTFRGIAAHSLQAGEHFDVKQWSTTGASYTLSKVVSSSQHCRARPPTPKIKNDRDSRGISVFA